MSAGRFSKSTPRKPASGVHVCRIEKVSSGDWCFLSGVVLPFVIENLSRASPFGIENRSEASLFAFENRIKAPPFVILNRSEAEVKDPAPLLTHRNDDQQGCGILRLAPQDDNGGRRCRAAKGLRLRMTMGGVDAGLLKACASG